MRASVRGRGDVEGSRERWAASRLAAGHRDVGVGGLRAGARFGIRTSAVGVRLRGEIDEVEAHSRSPRAFALSEEATEWNRNPLAGRHGSSAIVDRQKLLSLQRTERSGCIRLDLGGL